MKHNLVVLLTSLSLSVLAQVYTVETVPNTKLVNNSYVSDPSKILHDTTLNSINLLLGGLEKAATAQVAVVILPSIGEVDHVDFAQRLFRHRGIGQAGNNHGLLIVLIMDQRNVRFHTGYGVEGVLPDVTCKRIQQRFMVPHFKVGDYNTGMLEGIKATVSILSQPEAIEELFALDSSQDHYAYLTLAGLYVVVSLIFYLVIIRSRKFKPSTDYPAVTLTRAYWFVLYFIVPLFLFFMAYTLKWSIGLFSLAFYSLIASWFIEGLIRVAMIGGNLHVLAGSRMLTTF